MVTRVADYHDIALADPEQRWELHRGRMVEKEPLAIQHGDRIYEVSFALRAQLPRDRFYVSVNHGRVRRGNESVYIPDIVVVPIDAARALMGTPLEVFEEPALLIVEVWSPSTARIDFHEKLPEYQRRGDREIWRLHPFDLTVAAWVRQDDGTYIQRSYGPDDEIRPEYLPEVVIRLTDLPLL